jgi:hypothetical protein
VSELAPEIRSAVEAVAGHFSVKSEHGEAAADAYFTFGGRRIAVVVGVLGTGRGRIAKPRLRYDRVALRFVRDLRDALRPLLMQGEAVLISIRAPILQPARTVAALQQTFRLNRHSGAAKTELRTRCSGNHIRLRTVRGAAQSDTDVLSFVHSAGANPAIILDAAQSFLDVLRLKSKPAAAAARRQSRWLAIAADPALGETLRDASVQLSSPPGFDKILLVNGSRIETLAG